MQVTWGSAGNRDKSGGWSGAWQLGAVGVMKRADITSFPEIHGGVQYSS